MSTWRGRDGVGCIASNLDDIGRLTLLQSIGSGVVRTNAGSASLFPRDAPELCTVSQVMQSTAPVRSRLTFELFGLKRAQRGCAAHNNVIGQMN